MYNLHYKQNGKCHCILQCITAFQLGYTKRITCPTEFATWSTCLSHRMESLNIVKLLYTVDLAAYHSHTVQIMILEYSASWLRSLLELD